MASDVPAMQDDMYDVSDYLCLREVPPPSKTFAEAACALAPILPDVLALIVLGYHSVDINYLLDILKHLPRQCIVDMVGLNIRSIMLAHTDRGSIIAVKSPDGTMYCWKSYYDIPLKINRMTNGHKKQRGGQSSGGGLGAEMRIRRSTCTMINGLLCENDFPCKEGLVVRRERNIEWLECP